MEQIRDLTIEGALLRKRGAARKAELADLKADLKDDCDARVQLEKELDTLKQQLADHTKQVETADGRW
ncbi:MAG: hypothetical protein K2V38_09585 [Gemmataceae bacterium]|nr:hypothetical protein [Gemmataceae bacterium]